MSRESAAVRRRVQPWRVAFFAALTVAAVTRACLPFDGLYGQDAFAYFNYARALWPHAAHGSPLPDLYWPIGYPVTVSLLLPFTAGPAAGQIVNAMACAGAAAATSWLVEAFGRRSPEAAAYRRAALFAGIVVATSGAVLRYSQVVMADGLGLGAAALGLVCAVRYGQTGRGGWLVAAAAAWAWGTLARWMVGVLALPLLLAVALAGTERAKLGGGRRPLPWGWVAIAVAVGLAIFVPGLLVARATPQALERHEWLVNWDLRHAMGHEFHNPEGHVQYRLPVGLFYLARLGWPDYFFPVFLVFAAAGAVVVLRERRWMFVVLLLGWPLAAWVLISGIPYQNPRFLLPTLPAVGALFGVGFVAVDGVPKLRKVARAAVLAGALAGLAFGAREHARLVARKNSDLDLLAWTASKLPARARLLMSGPTLLFEYYGAMHVDGLFSMTDRDLVALLSSGAPLLLLADVDEIEGRWTGLALERQFEGLRRDPGLQSLGMHAPYTLFRVGGER